MPTCKKFFFSFPLIFKLLQIAINDKMTSIYEVTNG